MTSADYSVTIVASFCLTLMFLAWFINRVLTHAKEMREEENTHKEVMAGKLQREDTLEEKS